MKQFKEITPYQLEANPFALFNKDWGLVTAGDKESFNTMTVSWGGVGILWNKPVAFTFIRPQRYTIKFTEAREYSSICFFEEDFRAALRLCGSKSGREVDKVKETGLTPAFTDEGVPYFEEAKLVLICKKLYAQDFNEQSALDDLVRKNYSGGDYHRMYISEIVRILRAE